jgi:hypothetical protein
MRRDRQKLEDITGTLSELPSVWMDEHAEMVIQLASDLPRKRNITLEDLGRILDEQFDVGMTFLRLVLSMPKDRFEPALREALGSSGAGLTRFRKDREGFLAGLDTLGVVGTLNDLIHTPVSWQDLIAERLRHMRGSAISGQKRGRSLEDFTEGIVKRVFGDRLYCMRCTFVTAEGKQSTDTIDFCIPDRADPSILIEAKGYGATGSKQSDILPKCERIISQKRHDTTFLLVTDGITWRQRVNDLRKLIGLQNQGRIAKIYTQKMVDLLEADLRELRTNYRL